jgi:flagellar hook assembly protein FlgD
VRGNHEEINGWDDDGTADNTAVWSGKAFLKWFPSPLPSSFYAGNTTPHPEIGLPGNYYAFNAGDLRFRVLDPYLYSMTRPHNGHGETGGSLNNWDWTIGDAQYEWLTNDLATQEAPFSMVILHHKTSTYVGAGYHYGRGGIEVASNAIAGRPTFEWGGEDSTGAYVLPQHRPGWLEPIHDVLLRYETQIVTKGHDHFWARQNLDGITYLTLPKPNDTGQHTGNLWGWRWSANYPEEVTLFESNSGFVNMIVHPSEVTIEYIQSFPYAGAGTVLDSFTLLPRSGVTGVRDGPWIEHEIRANAITSVYPNPAVSSTRIEYALGRAQEVRITIYDAGGRRVRDLANGPHDVGVHHARWDGRDRNDRRVASGVYFAHMIAADGSTDSVRLIRIQ